MTLALVVAACAPSGGVDASGNPIGSPQPPLRPASPGADPVGLLAWLFTPLFQVLFIILAAVYQGLENLAVPGAIGVAIVVLTLIVRAILIPLFRKQLVSQKRIQMLSPEVKEIQKRYKGDRLKMQQAQQELYRERGVNPLAGCLPLLLQLPLLFIMYTVIQNGLTNQDPNAMLNVFGAQLVTLDCTNAGNPNLPCIDPQVPLLGDVSRPQVLFSVFGLGFSILAVVSALLQLVQSRMMLPPADPDNTDPNVRIQRQMMLFLPLISIVYGGFLPAGLFIYWIVATIFSIVQQYLIVGWGGTFPFLGWHPEFARNHAPRYPVAMPAIKPADPSAPSAVERAKSVDRDISAQATIRPNRTRSGRRGRRR
jgi:YidC/Oxa1 family membrane protein insertase